MARVYHSQLTTAQKKAVPLFVGGMNARQVSKEIGVAEQTVSKWMAGDLGQYLEQLELENIKALQRKVQGYASEALETVREILMNPEEKASDRLTAAKLIITASGVMTPKTPLVTISLGDGDSGDPGADLAISLGALRDALKEARVSVPAGEVLDLVPTSGGFAQDEDGDGDGSER